MTRNQKIALGCGGAGCLGLIVAAVAGVFIFFFAWRTVPYSDSNYNRVVTTNGNSNLNDNSNSSTNTNENDNGNDNTSNSSSTSASSMSEDDKHKLYQAAVMTGDAELLRRVSVKIGLMDDDYTPGDNYSTFVQAHVTWVISNTDFVQSIGSQEKAREYVNQNFPN